MFTSLWQKLLEPFSTCTCKLYNIHTAWYADTNVIYSGYGKMYYDHIQLPLVASKHKNVTKNIGFFV